MSVWIRVATALVAAFVAAACATARPEPGRGDSERGSPGPRAMEATTGRERTNAPEALRDSKSSSWSAEVAIRLDDGGVVAATLRCGLAEPRRGETKECGAESNEYDRNESECDKHVDNYRYCSGGTEVSGFARFVLSGADGGAEVPDLSKVETRVKVVEWVSLGDPRELDGSASTAISNAGMTVWSLEWIPTERQCLAIIAAVDVEWVFEEDVLRLPPDVLESLQEHLRTLARRRGVQEGVE